MTLRRAYATSANVKGVEVNDGVNVNVAVKLNAGVNVDVHVKAGDGAASRWRA